jgi:hypothetical protein
MSNDRRLICDRLSFEPVDGRSARQKADILLTSRLAAVTVFQN